ncbi:FecR family protein [Filimonas lacunae]|uniref:FecR family protein n=1 Tax=Filimonas lacunae TaxID=477680 RepID=A0A1N7R4D4_9BACT|nr:FecR family protein [Filimonas lacunae]SIT30008.1 FecR family protein [Filimonas lacunae]
MNEELLTSLEKKWLNGTITREEMDLYAAWYSDNQGADVLVPAAIAEDREQHRLQVLSAIEQEIAKEDPAVRFTQPAKVRSVKRATIIYLSGAAAVIVACILSYVLFFPSKKVPQLANVVSDKKPGQAGLVLTMNDGRKLLLDTLQDGVVSVEQGIKVIKENGTLRYEGKGVGNIYNTATTNRGRRYRVQLPDGSEVWLNAGSEIRYPLNFEKGIRLVELKGEAYFDIVQQAKAPFMVKVDGVEVNVLGTRFTINAYADEPAIATTLIEGSVSVHAGGKQSLLKPNQAAIKPRSTEELKVVEVDADNATGWLKNKFVFDNMKLDEIMRSIERWYGITVVYADNVNRNIVFTGSTPMNQNLSEVIKVLSLSGIHCVLKENTLYVK